MPMTENAGIAAPQEPGPPRGLALMLCTGCFDSLHAAFMLAAAALAMNRPVLLFAMGPGVMALCREVPELTRAEAAARLDARGVASFFVLREAVLAMDATLLACESGLRRMEVGVDDLLPGTEIVGLPTFLERTEGSQILTF